MSNIELPQHELNRLEKERKQKIEDFKNKLLEFQEKEGMILQPRLHISEQGVIPVLVILEVKTDVPESNNTK